MIILVREERFYRENKRIETQLRNFQPFGHESFPAALARLNVVIGETGDQDEDKIFLEKDDEEEDGLRAQLREHLSTWMGAGKKPLFSLTRRFSVSGRNTSGSGFSG